MAQYFELPLETDKSGPLNLPENMHPMLEKCVEILEPMFIEDIITKEGMGLLANPKQWVALLQVGERSQPRATAGSEAAPQFSASSSWSGSSAKALPQRRCTH